LNWNTESELADAFRKKVIWGSAAVVVLGLAVAFYYYRYYANAPVVPKPAAPSPPVAAQPANEPEVRNPVPEGAAAEKPLPPLKESDSDVQQALSSIAGADGIAKFLVPEHLVRHIVVTVDNLPRKKVAVELRPVKPTPGDTVAATQGDVTTLSEANYERYAPVMRMVQSMDTQSLADTYFRLYPLFQQAYEDLGYPGQYFNDRLVEVIDDMLRAPDVQGPVQLMQPKVFYEYADPKLEGLSAGQKLLIRMGPKNEAIAKAKLRELRKAVASRPEQPVTH
jgi:hypothetical protein